MYWCTECKQSCTGKVFDFGIGAYEFWGQRCVQTQKAYVSTCCEADVSTNPECTNIYTLEDVLNAQQCEQEEQRDHTDI